MDTLSIICLLVKLFVLWFHSVCGSLCFLFDRTSVHLEIAFCRTHFFSLLYVLLVSTQRHLDVNSCRCELFCSHLSAWIFLSVASDTCFLHVSLDFSVPCTLFTWNSDWIFLSVAFYRSRLLRSLFLWQSCILMIGMQRSLCELFCSHLLDFSVRIQFPGENVLLLDFVPSSFSALWVSPPFFFGSYC